MDDLPLVSIVTPSFNQARFLSRTIDSVLRQDYPHIEYYVCDGGSTDGSLDVLRSYGPDLAWVSEADAGQSDAINKGFARARGAILAYLNSDDTLEPAAVSTAVAYFRAHPDWDAIYGNARHIDADDRDLGPYPTADYSFARLLESCCICQPATFWRRSFAERVGPFDTNLHYAMDYDYWMRIDRAGGRIIHVPELLARSRLHEDTKTLSCRPEVYREILHVCRRHGGEVSFSQCLAAWHHELHEGRGWTRWLQPLPYAAWWLTLLQTRWERSGCRPLSFLADLARSTRRRLAKGADLVERPLTSPKR